MNSSLATLCDPMPGDNTPDAQVSQKMKVLTDKTAKVLQATELHRTQIAEVKRALVNIKHSLLESNQNISLINNKLSTENATLKQALAETNFRIDALVARNEALETELFDKERRINRLEEARQPNIKRKVKIDQKLEEIETKMNEVSPHEQTLTSAMVWLDKKMDNLKTANEQALIQMNQKLEEIEEKPRGQSLTEQVLISTMFHLKEDVDTQKAMNERTLGQINAMERQINRHPSAYDYKAIAEQVIATLQSAAKYS